MADRIWQKRHKIMSPCVKLKTSSIQQSFSKIIDEIKNECKIILSQKCWRIRPLGDATQIG